MKQIHIRDCGDCRLYVTAIDSSSANRRQAETEAVGRLVREAFGPDAVVGHHSSGAPYISGKHTPVSISHSRRTACLAVGHDRPVGVDVEEAREQLRHVAPRILSRAELMVYGKSLSLLLKAWSMKEALYKAALIPGLDFRTDIMLPDNPDNPTASVRERIFNILLVDETADRTIVLTQPREP